MENILKLIRLVVAFTLLIGAVSFAQQQKLNIPADMSSEDLLDAAKSATQAKNFPVAKQLFEELVRRNPRHPTAWADLGWAEIFSSGSAKDAEAAFRKQIEIDAFHDTAYRGLGVALLMQGKNAASEEALHKQLELNPLDADTLRVLGALYAQQRREKEAIEVLEKALRLLPEDINLKTILGNVYIQAGQKEKGDALLREAMHDAQPHLQANYEPYDAYEEIFTGVDAPVEESSRVSADAGLMAARARQQQVSEALLQSESGAPTARELLLSNELAVSWAAVGAAWLRKGDIAAAERYLHASWLLALAPSVAKQLAKIYEKQSKWAEATRYYYFGPMGAGARKLIRNDQEPEAIGRRLRKHLTNAQFAQVIKESNNLSSDLRTVFLDHVGHTKQTSAEFAISLGNHGRMAVLESARVINGDASLQHFETILKTTNFKLEFPDDLPARIIRHGWVYCGVTGCSFTLDVLPRPLSPESQKEVDRMLQR